MKLFRHSILKASIALLSGMVFITSCAKKYSDDTPIPSVATNTIYVGNDNNHVVALDPNTGAKKWSFNAGSPIYANVVIHDNAAYVASTAGILFKLDRATGHVINQRNFEAPILVTPLVYNNKLYVAAGSTLHMIDNTDLSTLFSGNASGIISGAPTPSKIYGLEGEYIFVAAQGSVTSFKFDDLSTNSTFDAPNGGVFTMSPCIESDSVMLIGSTSGHIYNVNTRDNQVRWTFETNGPNRSQILTISGYVLSGSDDRVFRAIDLSSGRLIWSKDIADKVVGAPYVYNQKVYFGGFDKKIHCIDIIDGITLWEMTTIGLVKGAPIVHQDKLYIGGYDHMLYCLNAEDGTKYWTKNVGGLITGGPTLDNLVEVIVPATDGNHPLK